MLCSLPRVRSVVEISYGCIGRSCRQRQHGQRQRIGHPATCSSTYLQSRLLEIEYSRIVTEACQRRCPRACRISRRQRTTVRSPTSRGPVRAERRRTSTDDPEVGEFRPGSPLSQWGLARYLVGRAITESVGAALLIVAVVVLALAALAEWGAHSTVARRAARAGRRRRADPALGDAGDRAPADRLSRASARSRSRMTALVDDTRSDVLRELRRLGTARAHADAAAARVPIPRSRGGARTPSRDCAGSTSTAPCRRPASTRCSCCSATGVRRRCRAPNAGWQTGPHD